VRSRLKRDITRESEALAAARYSRRPPSTATLSEVSGPLHLVQPECRVVWNRTPRAALTELSDRDGDTAAGRALVQFEAGGRIDRATVEARRLLCEWFGSRDGRLPRALKKWFVLARPGNPYIERRNGSILTVEATGDFTLTLRERVSDDAQLTPREREVLDLVADGLTTRRSRAGSGSRSRRLRSTSSRRIRSSASIAVRRPSRGSRSCRTSHTAVTRAGKRFRAPSSVVKPCTGGASVVTVSREATRNSCISPLLPHSMGM
jgi:hypothetical protein